MSGIYSNVISFDTTFSNLYIDTLQTNNSWQIGAPHKILFDTAYLSSNAIVTDTIGYYPVNDTSSFVLKINKPTPFVPWVSNIMGPAPFIDFWSKIDTDSLLDFGSIEYSINDGTNWLPVNEFSFASDDHPACYVGGVPFFTGTWNTWFRTFIFLGGSGNPDYGIENVDSVLFKFTFVSDGVNTNKEGWIIDNIEYGTIQEVVGVNNIEKNNNFNIYPNPVDSDFTVTLKKTSTRNSELEIYNILGEKVYKSRIQNQKSEINISDLPGGIYFVKLISEKQIFTKKIIKE